MTTTYTARLHMLRASMARPVTLFTGQWADLPLTELAAKAGAWGFDGLELACWGDHFDVDAGARRRRLLPRAPRAARAPRPEVWTIGNHLVGQAVCDRIDARHQGVVPPDVWGDGDPEGVRQRAAEKIKDTARAAAAARRDDRHRLHRLADLAPALLVPAQRLRGRSSAATRSSPSASSPIIDVFDAEGVKFALEVHPTEIAYDFVTTRKTLDALDNREGFGINFDPSPLRAPVPRQRRVRHRVRRPHLPRARQGLDQAPRRPPLDPRLPPELRRGRRAAGTSSPPATATSTSRRCSAR